MNDLENWNQIQNDLDKLKRWAKNNRIVNLCMGKQKSDT